MIAPLRPSPTPAAPFLALLLAVLVIGGCRRQDQIGSITQYTRGGGGDGSQGGVAGAGKDGVIVLQALFSGALLTDGPPELGQLAPSNGEADVLPTTPVIAVFSESVDPASVNSGSFRLTGGGSGGPFDVPLPVPAAVGVDLATDGRVAVLLPTEPLEIGAAYSVDLTGVTDLEGNALVGMTSGGEDDGDNPFGVPGGGGGTSQSFQTFVPNGFQQPRFGVIAMYPPPGDTAAKRETLIRLFFNAPVDEATVQSGISVSIGNSPVAGDLAVLGDPRIVQFVVDAPFPLGAEVTVGVAAQVRSGPIPGLYPNGLPLSGGDFSETFRIHSVPTPASIQLPGNTPVQVAGVTFEGSLTQENLSAFRADVKVPSGSPNADSTTILFFQPKGGGSTAGRAFTKEKGVGKVAFDVNLGKGPDSAAFVDSGDFFPPRPMVIGAFAERGKLRSPLGPLELPDVFVKTSEPDVVLGPPSEEGAPYEFRTVLASPAIYGTATETITALRAVVNGAALPSTLDALALGGPAAVSDAAQFFITGTPVAAVPGGELGAGPRFLPLPIDELSITDIVGNQRVVRSPDAGAIHFEGSLGGPLEPTALEHLRVRVVAADTLLPLKNVEVRLDTYPFDVGNTPMVKKTGKKGEAVFPDTSGLGVRVLLTASKSGYDPFTVAGFDNPAFGDAAGAGLVLEKTDLPRLQVGVFTSNDVPNIGTDPADAFVASAASSGRPASGKNPTVEDSRFFVDALDDGTETYLRVDPARPFVVSSMEHDGNEIYVHQQSSVLASTDDLSLGFDYQEPGGTMDFAQSFANTVVVAADVTAAGIVEEPFDVTVARLVGTLPGLPDVFPVSFSPKPLGSPGALRTLFAPIPPSLWENEALPDVDPAYELLFQPSAGITPLPPSEAELEGAFRLEVEAAEVATTRLTRHRASLDFIPETEAKTAEPIRLPQIPLVQQEIGTTHPLVIQFDTSGGSQDFAAGRSLARIVLRPVGADVRWTVLVDGDAAGLAPGAFAFPDLALDPFDQVGEFEVTVEAIEMPVGFTFDAFTFSDVERAHRRLSRSETMTFDTTP
ncbi:MAG: Ig-like domain-containing protein [Planctomycetota bacterium JB042]